MRRWTERAAAELIAEEAKEKAEKEAREKAAREAREAKAAKKKDKKKKGKGAAAAPAQKARVQEVAEVEDDDDDDEGPVATMSSPFVALGETSGAGAGQDPGPSGTAGPAPTAQRGTVPLARNRELSKVEGLFPDEVCPPLPSSALCSASWFWGVLGCSFSFRGYSYSFLSFSSVEGILSFPSGKE